MREHPTDMELSAISAFWRQSSKEVHAEDESIVKKYEGVFNLEYPPPAFVGMCSAHLLSS
jgi:hypothetical protein